MYLVLKKSYKKTIYSFSDKNLIMENFHWMAEISDKKCIEIVQNLELFSIPEYAKKIIEIFENHKIILLLLEENIENLNEKFFHEVLFTMFVYQICQNIDDINANSKVDSLRQKLRHFILFSEYLDSNFLNVFWKDFNEKKKLEIEFLLCNANVIFEYEFFI